MISDPALQRLAALFGPPDLSSTRYELVGELGRGGMGVVYLARDRVLDREVAIKVVDRLADEARILARLEHPGIVPVHDSGELADGRIFYAMKRVKGERLDRWLAGTIDVAERLRVFLRVCDTVAFAHAHGVVHRDLKPENIMIGEFGEVLVMDWGISTGDETAGSASARAAEAVAGTPRYIAPEVAAGDPRADHRADIYALGVVLGDIVSIAPVDAIARKARQSAAADRYDSVSSLAADVMRFLDGRAVEAHRERFRDVAARVWRRYRVPIALVLTYLIVRVLLLWAVRV
jgi:serine/threonine protein kinase